MVRNHHTPPSPDPAPGPGTESTLARPEFTPTPGPWKAIKWSCHAATTVVADRPDGKPLVICECSGHGRAADECLDDARLIAAVPRMLAVLRKLCVPISINDLAKPGVREFIDQRTAEEARAILRELEGGGQ